MDKKEWLRQLKHLESEIKELDILVLNCDSATEIKRLRQLKQKREAEHDKIIKAIKGVKEPLYRTVLLKKYMSGKSVKQIAKELHYAPEYVYHLIKKAEEQFEIK